MRTFTLTTHINGPQDSEPEVEITYTYRPGTPDVRYLPNGDPGYPGDPPEVNIFSITRDDDTPIDFDDLSTADQERILDLCYKAREDDYD